MMKIFPPVENLLILIFLFLISCAGGEDGKIIEEGNHKSLISLGGYYHGLYEKQLLEEKILEK